MGQQQVACLRGVQAASPEGPAAFFGCAKGRKWKQKGRALRKAWLRHTFVICTHLILTLCLTYLYLVGARLAAGNRRPDYGQLPLIGFSFLTKPVMPALVQQLNDVRANISRVSCASRMATKWLLQP